MKAGFFTRLSMNQVCRDETEKALARAARVCATGANLQLGHLQLSSPNGLDFDGLRSQGTGCCGRS